MRDDAPATAVAPGVAVTSLNGLQNAVSVAGLDATVGVTLVGQTIKLQGKNIQAVATVAALAALASGSLPDGSLVYVRTLKAAFALVASAQAASGVVRVAASGNAGHVWLRVQESTDWQSQMLWSVDESNTTALASDENTGVDDAHPLLTHAECARRLWLAQAPAGTQYTVRSLSNMVTTGAIYNVRGLGARGGAPVGISPLNAALNIVGVPAAAIYSGAIATPVQALRGTVGDIHFTDGGAPAFSTATGRIWTTTAPQVSYFWPLKDLTGGVFRVGVPARKGNNNARTLTAGDAWSILQLPTAVGLVNVASLSPNGLTTQIALLDIRDQGATTLDVGNVSYGACDFTGSNCAYSGAIEWRNCRNWRYGDTQAAQPTAVIIGGVVNAAATGGTVAATGRTLWTGSSTVYTCFQGIRLILDHSAEVDEGQFSFYDCVDCVEVNVSVASSQVRCEVLFIGGTGNTGKLIRNAALNSTVFVGTAAAGATSDPSPFQLGATVSATANLADPRMGSTVLSAAATTVQGVTNSSSALWVYGLGANSTLPDADATIDPAADKAGLYILPTLTANRILTITNGAAATLGFRIWRQDTSAFTYTIKNSIGTVLWTSPANPGAQIVYSPYSNAGVWIASEFFYAAAP